MAEKSKIGWTTSTFNPWIGCTRVGPGCDHCYAEALDKRARYGGAVHWGAGVPRFRTSQKNWQGPLRWNKQQEEAFGRFAAGKATRPTPWRVFCASLADVFDNEAPDQWRADLWGLIRATPYLSWLVVTKRIGNVAKMVPALWLPGGFPANVRLLITVCNQEEADRDVPKLLALPCKNGISYEPALGPVDWRGWLKRPYQLPAGPHPSLEWIIVGGESTQGAKARPFNIEWAYWTVEQCEATGVPVFVKQLGSLPHGSLNNKRPLPHELVVLKDRAGADPAEWPEHLRVQEFPS